MSNYWKKKWAELEEEEKKSRNFNTSKTPAKTTSYWQKKMDELEEEERNKSTTTTVTDDDIAPVKTTEDRKWFQKGAFEDGYQFGDLLKTINASSEDLGNNVTAGILGIGEKVVDAGAYLVGSVGKAFGADEFAEKTKNFIAKDLYDEEALAKKLTVVGNPFYSATTRKILGIDDVEEDSVFGEKTDSVAQSGGQLVAQIGLQSVGVPWFVTSGVTSFGSEVESAFNEGATYGEAGLSGAITAGAEILTEKLSGGIKFGNMGTLDDGLTKALARGISNKFVRSAAKFGMDVVGEGTEEVLSEGISRFGQWLTYQDDKTLTEMLSSEEAVDAYIESFIGGGMLGGVGSVTQGIKAKTEGRDATSGLTANEEKVFNKIFEDRLAEAEKNGEKISKTELHEKILKEMERGEIDIDTIESVLGGDTYKSYKDTVDSEEAILKEFEELGNKQNATLAEQSRYAELKAKVEEIKSNSKRPEFRKQLNDELGKTISNDNYLLESYAERARRGTAFEADLSQYDEKQKATIQGAIDSGILNNTRKTHEFVDFVAKLSADKGVSFDFTNNEKIKISSFAVEGATVNGYKYTKDDGSVGIGINIQSPKYLNSVVGHEVTHVLEGTEIYGELQKTLFEYAKSKGEYDSRRADLGKLYSEKDIDSELTADLVGDYLFTDSDFINNLSTKNRNVFQKIYDEIKYLCKIATAGSKEARELEKVKKAFEKAYKESGKSQSDTQHSLNPEASARITSAVEHFGVTSDFAKAGFIIPNGSMLNLGKVSTMGGVQHRAIKSVFEDQSGDVVNQFIQEGNVRIKDESNGAEIGASVPLTSLQKIVLTRFANKCIRENGVFYLDITGANGEYIATKRYFEGESSDIVYDIEGYYKDGTIPKERVYYSLSDSDGKKLTKEQSEYFKDSKMRDDNGNLKVMYHGSQDAGFHTFEQRFSDDDTSFFFVDRNDVAASYSGTSETYEAKTIRSAEDMNNFLAEIGYDSYEAVEKDGKFELLENNEHVAYSDTAQGLYDEFCWYEGVGEGDANYKVYLNLKNPLIVDGKGRPWNKIDAEFSQEVYDKYKSLTAEEKAALTDLAEWEDFRVFNSEIQEAKGNDLASAYAKMGEDVNIYDLFSVAADNFSEDSMRENARHYLKTRDYAQRAKEGGYDGVIFKNIVDNGGYSNGSEGASTVAIAFESNQIKSVANEKPTGDADIRYSLSMDSQGRELSTAQQNYFKDSKVVDENGSLKVMYHGTPNGDFSVFKDGTYFTENKWYADLYQNPSASSISTGKAATNPKTFEVYLDIKKPFDINDAEARSIYINDYIKGGNAVGIDPYLSDAEYDKIDTIDWTEGEDLREFLIDNGYDYDGLVLDEGAVGGYGDDVKYRGKSYVVFSPEQAKNVDNKAPTLDPDIRFSLSKPVEETKDLMALHNLKSNELLKSLELGGLPMPSIAVIKAESSHDQYGEVSLILPKEVIDPKANRNNKVYGGDAWTPTYPKIEFKANEAVAEKISDKYYELSRKYGTDELRSLYKYTYDAEDTLNRHGGESAMLEDLYDSTGMMQVYLLDIGKGKIEPIRKETRTELSEAEVEMNEFFIKELGADVVDGVMNLGILSPSEHRIKYWGEHGENIKEAYRKLLSEEYGFSQEEIENVLIGMKTYDYMKFIRDAHLYRKNGRVTTKTEIDHKATEEAIRKAASEGYKDWVDSLFKGIEEKSGIRNNVDYFTNSGNRRKWEALHWENTLENVVRVMKQQNQTGADAIFGAHQIFAVSAKDYGSIDEIKADSDRLYKMSEEEYEAIKESYSSRMLDIANRIMDKGERNQFIAIDNAMECIVDAVRKSKTKAGIHKELKQYSQLNVTEQDVADIVSLVNDISNMPTGYFEAKPMRAVGFEEVGVFVIPRNADVKLKQELLNRGYSIAEYDPDVEGDRQKVVNSFEEYKFSLSNVNETPKRYGNYAVSGKDIALEKAPMQEDIAPVQEGVAENATTTLPIDDTDYSPVVDEKAELEAEIERIGAEIEALNNEFEKLAVQAQQQVISFDEYTAFVDENSPRWEELTKQRDSLIEKVMELERAETAMQSERLNSLDDADAPPEIEAPYNAPREAVTLDDNALTEITKEVNNILSLDEEDSRRMAETIQKFAQNENLTESELFEEIKDNFEYYEEIAFDELDDELSRAKKYMKSTKLYIPKDYKGDFHGKRADGFNAFRKEHFGHFHLTTNEASNAMSVNQFYVELNGQFPNLFPADVINVADQLAIMGEVADKAQKTVVRSAPFNDETIQKVCDTISNGIARYSEGEAQRYAEEERNSSLESIGADIAPVAETSDKAYEAIRPPKKSQEPKMKRVKPDSVTQEKLQGLYNGGNNSSIPTAEKIAQIYDTEPEAPKKKGSGWSWFMRNFVDKQHVFETLALKTKNRELMAKADQMHRAESSAQWLIGHGKGKVRALNDIRKEVESSGLTKQFYEYMYHVHNVDRMTLDIRFGIANKAVFGDSVTANVSQSEVKKLEAKHPEFKRWANDVYKYNSYLRNMLVKNGVISQQTADLWRDMYPHYVPIRRVGDSGININVPLDTGRTGINAPIKKATGGNSDILPLFDTMAMRTEQTFKAIAKNRFGVELKNTLGTTIDKQSASLDEVIEGIEKHEELLKKGENGQNPTFTVFENGERVTFEISEDMYEALKPAEGIVTKNSKTLNKLNNFRRGLITEYNPVFMATNAIKDAQDILMNSQHATKTYAKIPKAFWELAKKGKWYREYMENGGESNTYFDGKKNTFKKEDTGIKKFIGMPLRWISYLNNFVERAPRLAEYIASRESGASIDVAMLDAARVTTNFAAGGDVTKWANRNGATFLNASVQGAAQQVRNIREAKANGLKGWVQLAAKTAIAGIPALLLNGLLWDDDEDYEELSDYVKDNYYIVAKYGDGQFVRIPKGRAVAVIQDAFEQIGNAITGNDEVDLANFCELVINNLAPNNPIDNNIISPLVQAHTNKTWYGEELVPSRLQDLPNEEQYDESTDSLSKWLGEKTGMSPIRLNYLLDQYSGGVGDVFLPMMTPEAESGDNSLVGNLVAPFKDKFTTDSVMNNQNVSDFYETKDKLTVNAKASTATDEDVLMSKYINSVSSELGELYGLKREVQNSDLPDDRKYAKVRDIQDEINAIARESLNSYEDVYIEGDYAEIGDRHYRLNADGEWTKISDKQYDKQEDVTDELGISASDYWSNKSEYDFAYENPEKYAVAKSVGGYDFYKSYMSDLYEIKADKDESGKSIRGSRKEKVAEYVNSLDIDYGERLILFKGEYKADDTYNMDIIDYLNNREDISYDEMVSILKELGFEVDSKGNITWD